MYILYLDESGTHAEASHFVLAGLAVFEREIHWYSQDLDSLQSEYFPDLPEPVHFHASRLRVRRNARVEPPWDRLTDQQRIDLKGRVYNIIRNRSGTLFSCVIEKRYVEERGEDPYERAFEDVISRFDLYLSRVNDLAVREGKEEQRGLIVLAESGYQKTMGRLAQRLRQQGTRWGRRLNNVTDIPLFAPARDTRMLQFADFCANAIYGRYRSGLAGDFDLIAPRFDMDGGIVHGLSHLTTDQICACIACFSRHNR